MRLLEKLSVVAKQLGMAESTIECYSLWIKQFLRFSAVAHGGWRHPSELRTAGVEAFLNDMVLTRQLAGSTQNQALNALVWKFERNIGRTTVDVSFPAATAVGAQVWLTAFWFNGPALELTLVAAGYDPVGLVLVLTFDRPVDVSGFVGSAVVVFDPSINHERYTGSEASLVGMNGVSISLLAAGTVHGDTVSMNATAATGIVAVDDGGLWPGPFGIALPFSG